MRRSKYKINSSGRQCGICHEFKSWKNFYYSKKGIHQKDSACVLCKAKYMKTYNATHKQKREPASGVLAQGNPTGKSFMKNRDMRFLISLGQLSKKSWTYPQAAALLDGLNKETLKGNYDFNSIYKKYAPMKSLWSCHSMRIELTKAAGKGLTLQEYWNEGRPFSQMAIKNRIVVPGERKK